VIKFSNECSNEEDVDEVFDEGEMKLAIDRTPTATKRRAHMDTRNGGGLRLVAS